MIAQRLSAVVLFVCLWGGWQFVQARRPVAEPPVPLVAAPRAVWARDLLAGLGNRAPDEATVGFVVAWTVAEDSGNDAMSRNNLLNTTLCGHNAIGAINSDGACGVQHYATYQDGIDATVDTLMQGNFAGITAALQANDPERAKQALFASPWAESHYGWGSSWPQGGE